MSNQRRLGRGLEALLGRPLAAAGGEAPATVPFALGATAETLGGAPQGAAAPADSPRTEAPLSLIDPNPYQPRRDFSAEAIQELADSMNSHGLLQPLVVRRAGERFQLIAGERRLRAAKAAGWMQISVQVVDADDQEMAELAIVENMQRKDLNPIEKARSFEQYLERYRCTQEELARRLHVDRSTVANFVRLLELPETIQLSVRSGAISQGHARALLPLGDEREQLTLCRRIETEGLSVRATEQIAQEMVERADADPTQRRAAAGKLRARRTTDQVAALEQELRMATGCKVTIRQSARGAGRIVLQFANSDEFERLRGMLRGGVQQRRAG